MTNKRKVFKSNFLSLLGAFKGQVMSPKVLWTYSMPYTSYSTIKIPPFSGFGISGGPAGGPKGFLAGFKA